MPVAFVPAVLLKFLTVPTTKRKSDKMIQTSFTENANCICAICITATFDCVCIITDVGLICCTRAHGTGQRSSEHSVFQVLIIAAGVICLNTGSEFCILKKKIRFKCHIKIMK